MAEIITLKEEKEPSPDSFAFQSPFTAEIVDDEYSIYKLQYPVKPGEKPPTVSRQLMDRVETEYCQKYKKTFTDRINTEGFNHYSAEISECMHFIHKEEIYGMVLSGDKAITTTYYNKFNEAIAEAFNRRFDQRTWRYGGYSIYQICFDIKKAAGELDGARKNKSMLALRDEGFREGYRIYFLSFRITRTIERVFAESRNQMKEDFLRRVV